MNVREQMALLVAGRHADPHGLLGAHATRGGVRVRAWRPNAASVAVVLTGEGSGENGSRPRVRLRRVDPEGLFEGTISGARLPLRYELEVGYPDGGSYRLHDPYAFSPTLGELDLHLMREGRHEELAGRLGAHPTQVDGVTGVRFSVWAPNAQSVSVRGDFNAWDARLHPMRSLGSSSVWELFVPEAREGSRYKFEIRTPAGETRLKADPLALQAETPPDTASIVAVSHHRWGDEQWLRRREEAAHLREPISIYEVHLGSWRRTHQGEALAPRELAAELGAYVRDLGFTHVELLPIMAHPFTGSWGYQVTSYYAPTPRLGSPDETRELIDHLHQQGIGVILDWVPAHFPRDDWALARFDGTALYEHQDPRRGAHPDWGTLVFNLARNEVRNFLLANALFWLREYHADGLRVDAVASMLYRDYSRREGEWVPNEFGGREDLDAVAFLKELNELIYARVPGVLSVAEESTAWPGVSRPTYLGGLGFGFKWNMGWMHDTLEYFTKDPVYRRYSHHQLTFSLMYAFSENFVLPLSHDEVVHGKRSLLQKMPGDRWQQFANLRALYAYMWAHPGKKLLFMGQEFAQEHEWSHERSLDWHLLEQGDHAGMQALVRDLNRVYREQPALWERDSEAEGFWWLEPNDADANVLAFARADCAGRALVCVCSFSPVVREGYRVGVPHGGVWREALNTDASAYGGANVGNGGRVHAEPVPWHGQSHSLALTLPPLGVLWLVPHEQSPERAGASEERAAAVANDAADATGISDGAGAAGISDAAGAAGISDAAGAPAVRPRDRAAASEAAEAIAAAAADAERSARP
ncbi:MAG TPA: 1,4-alpha-glucan branching protein GlgB [Solirubrobacteraceae bacterium]|nr:1,4-alpha-glucan branching protein GlgB [Solirubrobacteraceae bacterium]